MISPTCLTLALALAGPTHPLPDAPTPPARPSKLQRTGVGLMGGGGALMVIGAGVLVPVSLTLATRATPPNPDDYTAVEPFEWDLYYYKLEMQKAARIGLAGAVVSIVGATTFVTGAIVWGAGRRRTRRLQAAVLPSRTGLDASLSLRF